MSTQKKPSLVVAPAKKTTPVVVPPVKGGTPPAPDVDLDNPTALQFMQHGDQTPSSQASAPVVKPHPDRPWESKNPDVIKPYLLRMPEPLHTMLEFLGETTYRESMHSIAMKAIQDCVLARLKERGLSEDEIRAFLPD